MLERERERQREIENHKELEGYKKMRQGWESEKDRKRGMVGERKIGISRKQIIGIDILQNIKI